MKRKFQIITLILILFFCVLSTAIYTIIDNKRFKIVEESIAVPGLPVSFNGFKILQISDLHGKYFGEKQADLIEVINQIDYDMIAFTGDMSNNQNRDVSIQSNQAILDLIDGVKNKDAMFWIDGNWGPFAMNTICDIFSGSITPIGESIQARGVILLTHPMFLTRDEDHIWITPVLSEPSFECYKNRLAVQNANNKSIEEQSLEQAIAFYQEFKGNGEIKILLNHYPLHTDSSNPESDYLMHLDYDLILSGHYHGGQIRLPLIGAIFVPSNQLGINNSGLFPNQKDVKGLTAYGPIPQYISAGLGSSKIIPLLNFRLFNTPEINLITLTQSEFR